MPRLKREIKGETGKIFIFIAKETANGFHVCFV